MFALALGSGLLAAPRPAPAQGAARAVTTCFETWTGRMRLHQLDAAIALCSRIVDDPSSAAAARGRAFGQRGLLHGRRWALVESSADALHGIADISEGFRLDRPDRERRQQLLLVRAKLHEAIGQFDKAFGDFRAVLQDDPGNDAARAGLRRLGQSDARRAIGAAAPPPS